MRELLLATAFVLAGPAVAQDVSMGAVLGVTMEEIRAGLTEMGYDVRKMEREDGEIEVKVVKGIAMIEIHVDAATGKVVKIENKYQ